MKSSYRLPLLAILALGAIGLEVSRAEAHFIWLTSDAPGDEPEAVLFFGESVADEAYHFPEALADTEIWCRTPGVERTRLKTTKVESDDRIGLVAPLPDAPRFDTPRRNDQAPQVLEATREYGIYGDFLLTYYAKHIRTANNGELATVGPSPDLKLDIVPKATDQGIELTVLWEGQPKAGVEVNVSVDGNSEDAEPQKFKTDAAGKITVKADDAGLVAVLANFYDATKGGELNGKKYTSAAQYATLTFRWRKPSRDAGNENLESKNPARTSPASRRFRSQCPASGRPSRTGTSMFTAATPVPSTITRRRISRGTSAASHSSAEPRGKSCRCRRRYRGSRWWPIAANSTASAA